MKPSLAAARHLHIPTPTPPPPPPLPSFMIGHRQRVDNPSIFMYYSRMQRQWMISDAVGLLETPPR